MKLKELSYERLVNLGNYETERHGASITLDESDDPEEAFEVLKEYVEYNLGLEKKSDLIQESKRKTQHGRKKNT